MCAGVCDDKRGGGRRYAVPWLVLPELWAGRFMALSASTCLYIPRGMAPLQYFCRKRKKQVLGWCWHETSFFTLPCRVPICHFRLCHAQGIFHISSDGGDNAILLLPYLIFSVCLVFCLLAGYFRARVGGVWSEIGEGEEEGGKNIKQGHSHWNQAEARRKSANRSWPEEENEWKSSTYCRPCAARTKQGKVRRLLQKSNKKRWHSFFVLKSLLCKL